MEKSKSSRKGDKGLTRRDFMASAAGSAATVTILPRQVLGGAGQTAPNDRLAVACVGVGSQGLRVMLNLLAMPEIEVVGVCDVNEGSDDYIEWGKNSMRDRLRGFLADDTYGRFSSGYVAGREPAREVVEAYYGKNNPSGKKRGCFAYADYREMLAAEPGIDAVVIATPDHHHAAASIAAMRAGKHVYCQKPMATSIYEARKMAEVAKDTGVATQVATGASGSESTCQLCEWIWSGAIGPVRAVRNWSNRPIWPQGIGRPIDRPSVPEGLDWDLWLGPAPERPYNPCYAPFAWRAWWDFGTGALGDMGCYSFDTIYRVLKLGAPERVEASATTVFSAVDVPRQTLDEGPPVSSIIRYDYAAREDMPPVTVTWYDGGIKPPRPETLEDEKELRDEGLYFVGDDGVILCGFSGQSPRLVPESKMKAFTPPASTLPRSPGHIEEWVTACKGGPPALANFEFAGTVTQGFLVGNVALRAGHSLQWDDVNAKATNVEGTDRFVHPEFRPGWL